jgi:hypothetical protein
MVAAVTLTPLLTANIYLELIQKIITGTIVYTSFILLTWKLCGRPDGIEATLFERLRITTNRL